MWDDVEGSESSSDDAMECVVDYKGIGADNFVSSFTHKKVTIKTLWLNE